MIIQILKLTVTAEIDNKINTESTHITLNKQLAIINLQINNHPWLIIANTPAKNSHTSEKEIKQYIKKHQLQLQHPVIVWSGNNLEPIWIELLEPKIAIASTNKINLKTEQALRTKQVKLHNTAQEGMIRWNSQDGFVRQEGLIN